MKRQASDERTASRRSLMTTRNSNGRCLEELEQIPAVHLKKPVLHLNTHL